MTRWRLRTGLPLPGLFGHTSIELERTGIICANRESYSFVGWGDGMSDNFWRLLKILSGFSVQGKWYAHARNPISVVGKWHYVTEDEYRRFQRKLHLLVFLIGPYNLYTRNSWQIPHRIVDAVIKDHAVVDFASIGRHGRNI